MNKKKMLETTECVPIKNNGRDYTDCMEFSLLRFMQIILFSEDQIKEKGYSEYVINEKMRIHDDIRNWIERFPRIYEKADYYIGEMGLIEREEWSKFVSDRSYFEYYRTDGAELFTNIKNIIIFCKELLGMDLDIDDPEPDNLRTITNILNECTGKNIRLYVGYKEKDILNISIEKIKNFMSKPQTDIDKLDKPKYGVISKRSILHLNVNTKVYNWNLYELYFKNEDLLTNKFITGHSAIM